MDITPSIVISLVALAVAATSAFFTFRNWRNSVEQREATQEARFRARWIRPVPPLLFVSGMENTPAKPKPAVLVIENIGAGTAFGLEMSFSGVGNIVSTGDAPNGWNSRAAGSVPRNMIRKGDVVSAAWQSSSGKQRKQDISLVPAPGLAADLPAS